MTTATGRHRRGQGLQGEDALLDQVNAEAKAAGISFAVSYAAEPCRAVAELYQNLDCDDQAFVLIFASPDYPRDALAQALSQVFMQCPVIGCTTAGEITPEGYETGSLTGVAFPKRHFRIATTLFSDLKRFSVDAGARATRCMVSRLGQTEGWRRLAILFADGLSRQEDALLSAFEPCLAPIPLVGGSAGDGMAFGETFILADGVFHDNAALLALIETNYGFKEIRFDHYRPTDIRMVVTEAQSAERLVSELNAEPATQEYARLIGVRPEELSPMSFATHPTMVRVGRNYHVRAILKVENETDLRFYSAIDCGLVLTIGEAQDIAEQLELALAALGAGTKAPEMILGFDCILRRLEAQQLQKERKVSEILRRHNVIGFNTYGEQFHGMHVNQTFVGVAFFSPGEGDPQ